MQSINKLSSLYMALLKNNVLVLLDVNADAGGFIPDDKYVCSDPNMRFILFTQ